MVSTGYSTGCGTCRKRKVKCDEARPTCVKCANAKPPRKCEGYAREFEFVVGGRGGRGIVHRPKQRPALQQLPQSPVRRRRSTPSDHKDDIDHAEFSVDLPRSPSSITDDTLFGFVVNGVLARAPEYVDYNWRSFFGVQHSAGPRSVSYGAARLVALAYFGRLHGDDRRFLSAADREYGRTLIRMRTAIDDPIARHDDALVAAAMFLQHYESLMYTSQLGWIQHAGGAASLIERRGPHRHIEYPAHGYFLMARGAILGHALFTRQSTFLEREEWKTIPWTRHPESRTYHQQLVDIATPIPRLMKTFRPFKDAALSQSERQALCAQYAPEVENVVRQTILWRWSFERGRPGIAWEVPCDVSTSFSISPRTKLPFYPTIYHFEDLGRAHVVNFYHCVAGVLVMMTTTIGQPHLFEKVLADLGRTHTPPEPTNPFPIPTSPASAHTIAQLAQQLAKTVDFYLQPQHAQQGAFSLLMPIRGMVLTFTMINDLERAAWAVDLGQRVVAQKIGYRVGSSVVGLRIPGLADDEVPEPLRFGVMGAKEESVKAVQGLQRDRVRGYSDDGK